MTPDDPPVHRRDALRAIGATAIAAPIAGCTSIGALTGSDGGSKPDGVVLGPPENYERRADIDLPHPEYGQSLPDVTVPAPLHDRELSTRGFVGDRHVMLTFIYTSCQTVCPGLTAALRRVQADSIEAEYADQVAFLPTTFDPAYDTGSVLAEYGDSMGVDDTAGNWYFLRPESPERARTVVDETFGVAFERAEQDDGGEDGESGDGTDQSGMDDGGNESGDHAGHHRMFVHSSLILIANADGVVERAYTGGPPTPGTLVDEMQTIVDRW